MTISILVEPSHAGFRATTAGPLELSTEAASAGEAVNAIQDMIEGRLERGAILIDHHVSPPRSPIPVLSLSENPLFDAWLAAMETYRAERETMKSGEDRTAIELFIAGVKGWEVGLRRFLDASADRK